MGGQRNVAVGRVVRPHGLKGELSVRCEDWAQNVLAAGMTVWFVPPPPTVRSARIAAVRRGPKGPLVTFENIGSIDEARQLVGATVLADPQDLPAGAAIPGPDACGILVVDETRGELGRVEEVIRTGANDVWVVVGEDEREVLLPVIDDVMLSVDEDARVAHVRLLPGLIED